MRPLEDPGIDGRIILKYTLKTGWESTDWISLAQIGTSCELCENINKFLGSIKYWEFSVYL
jgi:hypothetical protein